RSDSPDQRGRSRRHRRCHAHSHEGRGWRAPVCARPPLDELAATQKPSGTARVTLSRLRRDFRVQTWKAAWRGTRAFQATPRIVRGPRLSDVACDAGHRIDDVAREQGKRAEDRDRDDGKDDAVLGHRLPVFTGEPVVELLHRARPPWTISTPERTRVAFAPLSSAEWAAAISPAVGDRDPPEKEGYPRK